MNASMPRPIERFINVGSALFVVIDDAACGHDRNRTFGLFETSLFSDQKAAFEESLVGSVIDTGTDNFGTATPPATAPRLHDTTSANTWTATLFRFQRPVIIGSSPYWFMGCLPLEILAKRVGLPRRERMFGNGQIVWFTRQGVHPYGATGANEVPAMGWMERPAAVKAGPDRMPGRRNSGSVSPASTQRRDVRCGQARHQQPMWQEGSKLEDPMATIMIGIYYIFNRNNLL